MLAALHNLTQGGNIAWSLYLRYFTSFEFSHHRTYECGRMNANAPCFVSLQQCQIIEVAFPMYAYYTKAPLWIRGKKNKSWWNGIEGSKCFSALCQEWRGASWRCCSGAGKEFSVWTLVGKKQNLREMFKSFGGNLFGNISISVFCFWRKPTWRLSKQPHVGQKWASQPQICLLSLKKRKKEKSELK